MANKKPSYGFEISPAIDPENEDGASEQRYVFYMNTPAIRVISFKGGGTRVLVYIKFLEIAHRSGLLANAKETGGSSSGSIAGVFAAIHYENFLTRTAALEATTACDRYDIYGKSTAWKVYKVVTSPLYLVSKPLEWLGKIIGWAADQCNRILPGKIIGIPLKIASALLGSVSTLTSPRGIAGIRNLIADGGVYRGDEVEATLRERIRKDTHAGLHAILSKLGPEERKRAIDRMIAIGLGRAENGRLVLTPEITFNHLYELSLLPGSQFKEYYCTAVRVRDNSLVVFNKDTKPDMPLYKAVRLAITFPRYYQARSYEGETYIDGGAINNSPVNLAAPKPVSRFKSEQGITDNMARLNVRVEYPDETENKYLLWNKQPKMGKVRRFMHSIVTALAKRFTGGVDVFGKDAEVSRIIYDDFSQQTLQLPDFHVGQMEDNVSAKRRAQIDSEIENVAATYFDIHDQNEKAVIKHYQQLKDMPHDMRMKLLKHLRNPQVKTADIFVFPDTLPEELEAMRDREIEKISLLTAADTCQESTAMLARRLDIEPVNLKPVAEHDNHLPANVAEIERTEISNSARLDEIIERMRYKL